MNNIKTTIVINNNENLLLDIENEGVMTTFKHFDVLIKDFDEKAVSSDVANYLEVSYLSKAKWPPTWPVFGSPLTYVTDAAISKILQGKETFEGNSFMLNIHGQLHSVQRSDLKSHQFNGINLLGTDYLQNDLLVLTADYVNRNVKLDRAIKVELV